MGLKMDQRGLRIVFLYQICLCLCGNTLSEEMILNEVSLGGSPTIYFALQSTNHCNCCPTLTQYTALSPRNTQLSQLYLVLCDHWIYFCRGLPYLFKFC